MNPMVLGILIGIGVILTLFCMVCIEANRRNGDVADAELEAWRDWLEERERWARRQAVKEKFKEMGAEEMPMAETKEKTWQAIERKLQEKEARAGDEMKAEVKEETWQDVEKRLAGRGTE